MRPDPLRLARVALAWVARGGNFQVHQLAQTHGPQDALDRLLTGREPHIPLLADDDWPEEDLLGLARALLRDTKRLKARLVTPEDDEWPAQLDELSKLDTVDGVSARPAPLCLWVRGTPSLSEVLQRSVTVVGARACTSYGAHVATDLGRELAEAGCAVVSGAAYGVDSAAHRGALAAGGPTVALLGCGVDRAYPVSHAALLDRIVQAGLLVSEWPPGAAAMKFRFSLRSGLLAAATGGAVMVEAAARSQARRTLTYALGLGRPVMVVPGPVTTGLVTGGMSQGCHRFLREHPQARLVTNAAEVITEINHGGTPAGPAGSPVSMPAPDRVTYRTTMPNPTPGATDGEHRTSHRAVFVRTRLGWWMWSYHTSEQAAQSTADSIAPLYEAVTVAPVSVRYEADTATDDPGGEP